MLRISSLRIAVLATCLAFPVGAMAQQVGGDVAMEGLTNGNFQNGVNSAISTGQIGSNSRSRSNATGGAANAAGGAVTNNLSVGGQGGIGNTTATIRAAPPVFAPSLQGANPCTAGVSGGSSWVPFGFAFGAQWSERQCRDQEWFRILAQTGNAEAGRAYICERYSELRQAFATSGTPCPQDAPAVTQQVVQAAPAPVPAYCLRGRERGASDVLMREWNCP